jgi:hypothetical protein
VKWNEINDQSGKCIIKADLSITADFYTPEQVQTIIDEQGVRSFYELVNPKLQNRSKGRALMYISGNPDELIDHYFSMELS